MNGAEALLKTLADNGVEVCFANPGTSEMQMVAALDREPRVRPVLCLFEGVATGAADGYARMAGKPASTMLHLGPGLGNGTANLHNARRAYTPVINLIGDHATYHLKNDAPLASDILSLAKPNSVWVKSATTAEDAVALGVEAWTAAQAAPGGPASLILPADTMWTETTAKGTIAKKPAAASAPSARIEAAAKALKAAKKPLLLVGSPSLTEQGLIALGRIAATGVRVMTDTFVSRIPRGAGRYAPDRMLYFGEMAMADLGAADLMAYCTTKPPAAFFAYPDAPLLLIPEGCATETLAELTENGPAALLALADALGAPEAFAKAELAIPGAAPTGELTPYTIGASIARHLPEHAVVSDDAVTAGLPCFMTSAGARPHDWLMLTGGAIGQGMPCAVGAALGAPGRKVLSLNGDGAGAYTVQGLWSMVRENLPVVTVMFANHAYRILNIEMSRTRSGNAGPQSRKLLDLGDPRMDWVSLAKGFGMPAVRVDTAEAFDAALEHALAGDGPSLIEAVLG